MSTIIIKNREIDSIESDWRRLEKGRDMTYFQSFDWYKMLATKNRMTGGRCHEIVYVIVKEADTVVMIAPLWIIKKTFRIFNKASIHIFGSGTWTDYCNFIYDVFDERYVLSIFDKIKEVYGVNEMHFSKLKENTAMYAFLTQRYQISKSEPNVCVALDIPASEDEYWSSLSKNSRQNIRTAFNRLSKDGIELFFEGFDTGFSLQEFKTYRNIRVKEKNNNPVKLDLNWVKNLIGERLLFSFPEYAPFDDDKNSKFITAKTPSGKLCGAFCVGLDTYRKEIVVMAVSVNPGFYRYSPGILAMFSFIKKQIGQNEIRRIDFTRGNEPYKYTLGGKDHYIYSLVFNI